MHNLDDNVRVLYGVGQQLLWGMLGAVSAVLAVVFEGRGQADASLGAKIAAGVFGVFLFFTWLGGRPPKRKRRGR